ncbi:MAG TPA: hypothetical protein VEG08_02155 [Terriglobales bacterium]|nr:hypothetical protein [Terriglobales bacterium]
MTAAWRKELAVGVLGWATRLYPAERRGWGEAILAEAEAVAPEQAWSWMLGGVMVAMRAFFSGLLRRPARTTEPALAEPAGPPPPLPWKAALLCLGIAGALFFLPEMRQGVGVTLSTWQNGWPPGRPAAVQWEKLGREAESRGDAPAMAFAAMRLPGEQGVGLAERAVARDPGLTWVLFFVERHEAQGVQPRLHPELLQQVERWDPENAVPYLAAAQETSPFPFPPTAVRDARWRPLMDRAFAVPRYDDYIARRVQLEREVMKRWKRGSPLDALAMFFSLPIPSIKDLQDYAQERLTEGQKAERAGQLEQAAEDYWAVAHFGQRMELGAQTDLEQVVAAHLQRLSFQRLQPVLVRQGRLQEGEAVAYEAQLQAEVGKNVMRSRMERAEASSRSSAWLVQGAALLGALSLLALAAALAGWAAGRRRARWVRLGLRYAPPLLLASCALLPAAYYPYAQSFAAYLNGAGASSPRVLLGFLELWTIPQAAWSPAARPYLWSSVIALGSVACAWLLARTLRPASSRPAD